MSSRVPASLGRPTCRLVSETLFSVCHSQKYSGKRPQTKAVNAMLSTPSVKETWLRPSSSRRWRSRDTTLGQEATRVQM